MFGPEYKRLHRWMNDTFPRLARCEFCGRTGRRTEYASAGHSYTTWRHDWFELCSRCHQLFDGNVQGRRQARKTHCPQGHPYDESNTYRSSGGRSCRACNREAVRRYSARKRAIS